MADVGVEAAELAARALRSSSSAVPVWPVTQARRRARRAAPAPPWRRAAGGRRAARRGPGRGAGPGARSPAGRPSGWCCHSSASTRSTSPSASAGQRLLGLGLDQLAAQLGRVARERVRSRARPGAWATDWKAAMRPRPATVAGGRGELGLGQVGPLEQRLGVADQHERRRRSAARRGRRARAAARPASRSRTASCWETADGVNCSASATAAIVPRSCSSRSRRRRRRSSTVSDATDVRQKSASLLKRSTALCRPCPAPSSASPPPPPSAPWAIFGKLAYDEGATVGTLLAVRFASPRVLFWALVAATGGVRAAAVPRRDVGIALALGAVGYARRPARYFAALDRIDASLLSLLLYTFPAMVAVAAVALGRERAAPAHGRRARPRLGRPRARARRRGRGRLDAARRRARAGRRRRLQRPTSSARQGVAGRVRPLAAQRARVHRRRRHADPRHGRRRRPAPGAVTATGWGWLAGIAVVSTVAAVGLFFAGLRARRPDRARRSSRRSSR